MTIVVGVDGSEGSDVALRWALEEARLRRTPVRLVHAWSLAIGGHAAEAGAIGLIGGASQALLDRVVAEAREAAADVTLESVLGEGSAVGVLVDEARDAELLVVGSRGHGTFASLLLGSVADGCVRHAPCPVVVVRHAR